MLRMAGLLVVTFLCGCEIAESPRPPAPADRTVPAAALVNRAWRDTDEGAAPGSMRVFLEDGTLLMTSCAEVYRLARWEVLPDGRLRWDEDGRRVDATVVHQETDSLVLDLELGADRRLVHFATSSTPFVCRDQRPS
jgi:hypothetical protein